MKVSFCKIILRLLFIFDESDFQRILIWAEFRFLFILEIILKINTQYYRLW